VQTTTVMINCISGSCTHTGWPKSRNWNSDIWTGV